MSSSFGVEIWTFVHMGLIRPYKWRSNFDRKVFKDILIFLAKTWIQSLDATISGLLDMDDLGNRNISGGSNDSDANTTFLPKTKIDVDRKSSDNDKLIEVQLALWDHPKQHVARDHGPGHQPQLQTELYSDEDGGGEPSKSALKFERLGTWGW